MPVWTPIPSTSSRTSFRRSSTTTLRPPWRGSPGAFGFVLGEVIEGPDGTIAHAEMHYGPGTIMPKSAGEEMFGRSPRSLGGVSQAVFVAVKDPDSHFARAKAAGAEIVMEPTDMEFGARNYAARDPEGHLWGFGTYWPRDRSRA